MAYKFMQFHTKIRIFVIFGMVIIMLLTQVIPAPFFNIPFGVQDARAAISYEQEGFRFREDDGSETGATWIAPQDTNIIRARNVNTRLRTLINATDDPPSNQYQLEYLKTYSGSDPAVASTSYSTYTNATSFTLSHTVSSGEQLVVLVSAMSAQSDPYNESLYSATFNGVSMNSLPRSFTTTTNRKYVAQAFYLNNPSVGTYNVVVTSAMQASKSVISANSITGFSGTVGAMGINTEGCTVSLTTQYPNSLIMTAVTQRSNTTPPTSSPTGSNVELYDTSSGSADSEVVGAGYRLATTSAGSYTGGGTCSSSNGDSAFAVELVKNGLPYARVMNNITAPEITNSTSNSYGTASTSHTLSSHSVKSGEKLVVMVHALRANADQNFAYPDVTFNGQIMERVYVQSNTISNPSNMRLYTSIHVLSNPDAGTYDVIVTTPTSPSTPVLAVISAHSVIGFSGVIGVTDQSNNTCSLSVTTVANNSLLVTAASQRSAATPPTISPDGSNVELYELSSGSTTSHIVGGGYSLATTTAGSYTGGGSCTSTVGDSVVVVELTPESQKPIELAASSNIAASGANTTAQLTPPSGKNTGDFVTGRIQDDENPADAINITTDDYTELEWSIKATSAAASGETYRFRVTISGTALNTYTLYPEMSIGPTLTQNDWRIYVNNNAIDPTDPWPNGSLDLGENAYLDSAVRAHDPPEPSDVVRLRMSIAVTDEDLVSAGAGFILAYAEASDCTTASSWTDVDVHGGSGTWRFYNSAVTDGATITTRRLGVSDVSGRVSESDPTSTNPSAVTSGQDLEWDWVIQYNGTQQAKSYCFRFERADGTTLSAYNSDSYPRIETVPGVNDLMRHGNFYSTEVEKAFFWSGPASGNSPQYDTVASAEGNASSLTLSSYTVANNSNRILVCGTAVRGAVTVSSITWNSGAQSFTKIDDNQPASDLRVELWYLLAPTATTASIVITFSGTQNVMGGCVSLYNAKQSAPSGSAESNGSDSIPTINLPTSPGDLVIDISGDQSGPSVLSGTSIIDVLWQRERSDHDAGMSRQIATNGTTTMTWSQTADDFWAMIAVPIQPF